MALITAEQMLEALRQSVAEHGEDFVYKPHDADADCVYQEDGYPSCLVGHALSRLLPQAWQNVPGVQGNVDALSLDPEGEALDWDAKIVAWNAQYEQDKRKPWGKALEVAEEVFLDINRNRSTEGV